MHVLSSLVTIVADNLSSTRRLRAHWHIGESENNKYTKKYNFHAKIRQDKGKVGGVEI